VSKIEQLASFIKIVECGGLIRAAEALHLTPPALTKQMKALEGHLGTALFHRVSRRLILTEIGQQYYDEAARTLHNLIQLERLIKTGKKEVSGILKVRTTRASISTPD
jgi:DNA-binding transcriptional LysR family regulator